MIRTRVSLFATALVLFLAGGAPVEAQERCWWCNEWQGVRRALDGELQRMRLGAFRVAEPAS